MTKVIVFALFKGLSETSRSAEGMFTASARRSAQKRQDYFHGTVLLLPFRGGISGYGSMRGALH